MIATLFEVLYKFSHHIIVAHLLLLDQLVIQRSGKHKPLPACECEFYYLKVIYLSKKQIRIPT